MIHSQSKKILSNNEKFIEDQSCNSKYHHQTKNQAQLQAQVFLSIDFRNTISHCCKKCSIDGSNITRTKNQASFNQNNRSNQISISQTTNPNQKSASKTNNPNQKSTSKSSKSSRMLNQQFMNNSALMPIRLSK